MPSSAENTPSEVKPALQKLGLGCSGAWAQSWFSEGKAVDLIHQAIAGGITQFDTGNFYGGGRAETRLGRAISDLPAEKRAALRITTKTGTQATADGKLSKDFSHDTILRNVDTSLTRLGVGALDVLYLHGPDKHDLAASLPVLLRLKHEGIIRAIGVCARRRHLADAAAEPEVDALMGLFNLLDLSHYETFSAGKAAGKHICAISPLAQGLYRRGLFTPSTLSEVWYLARALFQNRQQLQAARNNTWLQQVEGWPAEQLALGFALASDLTDTVLINTTKPAHLAANIATTQRPFPPELYEDILTRSK